MKFINRLTDTPTVGTSCLIYDKVWDSVYNEMSAEAYEALEAAIRITTADATIYATVELLK